MTEPKELIALTPSQLLEVCVQFAAQMGWTDDVGGGEWAHRMQDRGPEAFSRDLIDALGAALESAEIEHHTNLEVLRDLAKEWEE